MNHNWKWLMWKAENLSNKDSAQQMLKYLRATEKELRKKLSDLQVKQGLVTGSDVIEEILG